MANIADLWLGKKTVLQSDPETGGYKLVVAGMLDGVVTGTYLQVIGPPVAATLNLCGIVTGIAASTYVNGPNVFNLNGFFIKAHPDNTDTIWYGGTGTNSRFPVNSGEITFVPVANLNLLWFSVDVAGEKVCWQKS